MLPSSMPIPAEPTHSLADMQAKVGIGHYYVTDRALSDAIDLGFDSADITDCICALTDEEFYRSDPSIDFPGTYQDIYKTWYCGKPIYTKLRLRQTLSGRKTVVISFHTDDSPYAPLEKNHEED